MTRAALQHTYPQWEPPEDEPWAPEEEWRETQRGLMRVVRNAKRARLLRKRGVRMWQTSDVKGRAWLWFVEHRPNCRCFACKAGQA